MRVHVHVCVCVCVCGGGIGNCNWTMFYMIVYNNNIVQGVSSLCLLTPFMAA